LEQDEKMSQRGFTPKILKKSVDIMKTKYGNRERLEVGDRLYRLAKNKSKSRLTKNRNSSRSITPSKSVRCNTQRRLRKSTLRSKSRKLRKTQSKVSTPRRISKRRIKHRSPIKFAQEEESSAEIKRKKKLKINSISSTLFLQKCEEIERKKKKRSAKSRKFVGSSKPSDLFDKMLEESMQSNYMINFVDTTPACQKKIDHNKTLEFSKSPSQSSVTPFGISVQSLQFAEKRKPRKTRTLNNSIEVFKPRQANQSKSRNLVKRKSCLKNANRSKSRNFKKKKSLRRRRKNGEDKENSKRRVNRLSSVNQFIEEIREPVGKSFIEINGVKIFYQEKSVAGIINQNMRKRIHFNEVAN
jgi:hypothetical protein